MNTFFIFIHGMGFAYMLFMGIYMLYSERNIFADTHPCPILRKIAGINLIAWATYFLTGAIMNTLKENGHGELEPIKILLDQFLLLFAAPLLMRLVQRPRVNWKKITLTAIAPAILLVAYIFFPSDIIVIASFSYWAIFFAIFLFIYSSKIKIYTQRLKENYADLENRELQWLNMVIFIFISYFIIFYLAHLVDSKIYYTVAYILGCSAWSYIVWHIEHQEKLDNFWDDLSDSTTEEEQGEQPFSEAEVPSEQNVQEGKFDWIGDKLRTECEDKQLYLDADLNITRLAQEIGTNRTYLSQYLRENNTNFYTYINTLRIRYSQTLTQSGEKYTVADIARLSGFNSVQSYRRVNYAITGKEDK